MDARQKAISVQLNSVAMRWDAAWNVTPYHPMIEQQLVEESWRLIALGIEHGYTTPFTMEIIDFIEVHKANESKVKSSGIRFRPQGWQFYLVAGYQTPFEADISVQFIPEENDYITEEHSYLRAGMINSLVDGVFRELWDFAFDNDLSRNNINVRSLVFGYYASICRLFSELVLHDGSTKAITLPKDHSTVTKCEEFIFKTWKKYNAEKLKRISYKEILDEVLREFPSDLQRIQMRGEVPITINATEEIKQVIDKLSKRERRKHERRLEDNEK